MKKTTVLTGNHVKNRDRAGSENELVNSLQFKGDLK